MLTPRPRRPVPHRQVANTAVDQVRRRTQNEQAGHRGRRDDPLYDIRRVLLTGSERLNAKAAQRLERALGQGDPRDEVLAAWLAKEHLREVYAVTHPDDAERLLDAVILECATSEVPELNRLARTLRRWRTEILNRHRTGDSNGPTEAMNLLIKQIKRLRLHQLRQLPPPTFCPLQPRMGHSTGC